MTDRTHYTDYTGDYTAPSRASDYTRTESLHGPVVRNYTNHYTHYTRTELHAGPPLFRGGPVVGMGGEMTDDTRPQLAHAPRCQRRSAPLLRLSWQARPELWCPECGRTAPADDTRPGRTS